MDHGRQIEVRTTPALARAPGLAGAGAWVVSGAPAPVGRGCWSTWPAPEPAPSSCGRRGAGGRRPGGAGVRPPSRCRTSTHRRWASSDRPGRGTGQHAAAGHRAAGPGRAAGQRAAGGRDTRCGGRRGRHRFRPVPAPPPMRRSRPTAGPALAAAAQPVRPVAVLPDRGRTAPARPNRPPPGRPRRRAPAPAADRGRRPRFGRPRCPTAPPPGRSTRSRATPDSMLFHRPDSPYFTRTKAEVWFRTATDARAAGFTEWVPKNRAPAPDRCHDRRKWSGRARVHVWCHSW